MKSLARSFAQPQAIGHRVDLPWGDLDSLVKVHTKELVMIAGAPGGGKSTLAINLAMMTDQPCLYIVQDNPASVFARAAALASNQEVARVFSQSQEPYKRQELAEQMVGKHPLLTFKQGRVAFTDIQREVEALTEWLGKAPTLVFIDNLIDTRVEGRNFHETTFYAELLPELKELANTQDTCIMVLHHVIRRGKDDDAGRDPLKMTDLMYAGDREARHVWGVYNDGMHGIYVQILKQQDGPADPGGGREVRLRWSPEYGKVI